MRREFIAMLSHDMKTPLSSIFGFTGMLDERLEERSELRELVERIDTNARIVYSLAANFLDVAQMESGSLQFHFESASLNDVVSAVLRHQDVIARAREISIESMLSRDLPKLRLDRRHMDRVVANLVSNAIKFSPVRGRIRVRTTCENGWVVLAVRDQGPGIPLEEQSHLFERFRRIGNPRVDGSGLGLYIVKQIVEAHGGRVSVDCPSEGGSVFRVAFESRPMAA
jgi:signal transduction histidine kinase